MKYIFVGVGAGKLANLAFYFLHSVLSRKYDAVMTHDDFIIIIIIILF